VRNIHLDQNMPQFDPAEAILAAATMVCDALKHRFEEPVRDLAHIRVPIFAVDSDVRVEVTCGPIAAATNAIEAAQIRAGGRPHHDLSAMDVLAGSVFLINTLRERLVEQAQKGDPEAIHLLSMAGDMVSRLQGMAALLDMQMPSDPTVKH
jgi:hypothetical protein